MSGRRGHGRLGRLRAGTLTGDTTGTTAPATPTTAEALDAGAAGLAGPTAQATPLTTGAAPTLPPLMSPGGAENYDTTSPWFSLKLNVYFSISPLSFTVKI